MQIVGLGLGNPHSSLAGGYTTSVGWLGIEFFVLVINSVINPVLNNLLSVTDFF
jgi:hypothetical protein